MDTSAEYHFITAVATSIFSVIHFAATYMLRVLSDSLLTWGDHTVPDKHKLQAKHNHLSLSALLLVPFTLNVFLMENLSEQFKYAILVSAKDVYTKSVL